MLALFSLTLGAFAIGTTEFIVAGLLPPIATAFGVGIPDAGLLVTGYALSVAIGGPVLALVAGRWPKKQGIIAVLSIFVVAHILCALAPTFGALMAGRALAGFAHGSFFGLALVLATASAAPGARGRALAMVVGGINIANVIGVPAGTAVGNAFGWRAAFVMVAVLATIAAIATAFFVPNAGPGETPRVRLGLQVRALKNRRVVTGFALIVLHMIAFFGTMTFIAPWLIGSGLPQAQLPLVLLGFGVAGTIGVFIGGRFVDRAPRATLVLSYPLAAAGFGLAWWLTPLSWVAGAAAISLVWAIGAIGALAAQNRALLGAANAPELASALMSSVFNVGIAIGAALTAALLGAGMPVAAIPLIGLVALSAASLLAAGAVLAD